MTPVQRPPAPPANLAPFRAKCNGCAAPILWAVTPEGEDVPVNPGTSHTGNVLLAVQNGELVAGVLNRGQASGARNAGHHLHRLHDVDCPRANGARTRH
ncbi:hypothetical protein [Prauserella endophytica]|uniref:Uncharacterized protein n=1 Tax=Prauserella endophytica TaxID=1592324 RepID=A0ABY2RS32_9PSEU|nr:hypothetical protein [Prauserella endophytica]TKG57953.1 hypothetical protein FCN18_38575 [Prauserella endophytica]